MWDDLHKARERLQEAQPGDTVIHYDRGSLPHIKQIKRVTPSQIILAWGKVEIRYWKKNGERVGASTWDKDWIKVPTPEELKEAQDQIRAHNLRGEVEALIVKKLRASILRNMSPELLESIREFLSELPSTPLM